ncbi:MAG: cytochrome ubiquinol oxidase subunit I [Alphaproteobacteria bacterium]|nr:cytochrome ubiquinol oxidase subunit I [Alphaproteobacteria bacterium]
MSFDFDATFLARLQFAANISFHILFPTLTISLGWLLFFFKRRFARTGEKVWLDMYFFWVRLFALAFALGIVSGVTMSFQFGTNWPGFMNKVGNIAGPLLGYEVMTSFFFEAIFLGIMVFGYRRVSPLVHDAATFIVAFSMTVSAFWILSLNSWMQTPAGFEMIDGKAYATDWLAVIFNPSMPYRMVHMLLASGLTAGFFMAGVAAYRWLAGHKTPVMKLSMKVGIYLAALLIPWQIMAGDLHGLNTREHQPQKVAAMEGLWETRQGAPLVLFAWPDEEARKNLYALEIPYASSMILTHDWNGAVEGLDSFKGNHPPVAPVFWSFRLMVGLGGLMLLVACVGAYQIYRRGEPNRLMLYALVPMSFSGWLATLLGWYVTEIGRQPWIVFEVMLTKEAAGPVASHWIGLTLVLYLLLYAALFWAFLWAVFVREEKGHA